MHDDKLNEAILDFKRGNSLAFNQIYSRTHILVYKCAFSMLKNESDANDIVQNVYIKVYNKLGCLKDESKFQSWLMSITYNEAKNMLSSQKKYSEVFNRESDITDDEYISFNASNTNNECDFENDYMVRETNNIIKDLIDELPQEQKEVLMMYYFEEKDISSIADILNCPKGTVQSRLNYSRKNLKKSINKYEEKNQVRLHSGIAMLLNVECMKKMFKYDTIFKVAAVGAVSACVATYGTTVLQINQKQDNDTQNIYKYEETSDTEETTVLTEKLLIDSSESDIETAVTTIPDYRTEESVVNRTENYETETGNVTEESATETYGSEVSEEVTINESMYDTYYNPPGFNWQTDRATPYFDMGNMPENVPPYNDKNFDMEKEDFRPPYESHYYFDDEKNYEHEYKPEYEFDYYEKNHDEFKYDADDEFKPDDDNPESDDE